MVKRALPSPDCHRTIAPDWLAAAGAVGGDRAGGRTSILLVGGARRAMLAGVSRRDRMASSLGAPLAPAAAIDYLSSDGKPMSGTDLDRKNVVGA